MFLKFNAYAILWLLIMIALNMIRGYSLQAHELFLGIYFDKLVHFTEFFILFLLVIIGLNKQNTFVILRFNSIRISLIFCLLFAIVLQTTHFYQSKGFFEFGDLFANILGILFGLVIFIIIYKNNAKD